MQPINGDRHYLPAMLQDRPISILLVGCGGNGAQMLMGLASLDTALRATSSRSLQVTTVDDDVVTEANLGRQPFFGCDVGNSKSRTLTERINLAHGLAWNAVHGRAPAAARIEGVDILISCVDTASARRALGAALGDGSGTPTTSTSSACLPCLNISRNSRTTACPKTMLHPVPSPRHLNANRSS